MLYSSLLSVWNLRYIWSLLTELYYSIADSVIIQHVLKQADIKTIWNHKEYIQTIDLTNFSPIYDHASIICSILIAGP